MDQLPQGSASRDNPRFNPAGRARELDDERNHLARLAVLLQRHGELATRLQEVADDDDEPQVVDETQAVEDSAVLTGTQTSRELIQMFDFDAAGVPGTGTLPAVQDDGEERLSTGRRGVRQSRDAVRWRMVIGRRRLRRPTGRLSFHPPDAGLAECDTPSKLQRRRLHQYRNNHPIVASAVFRQPAPSGLRPRIVPTSGGGAGVTPRFSVPVFPPRPVVQQPRGLRGPDNRPATKDRRGPSQRGPRKSLRERGCQGQARDRRFELSAWIRTRRDLVAKRLIAVEETIVQAGGPGILSPHWINE